MGEGGDGMRTAETLNTPAVAEEPPRQRAVRRHPLHHAGGQQAEHQLDSHQRLCQQADETSVSTITHFSIMQQYFHSCDCNYLQSHKKQMRRFKQDRYRTC